jgi:hypothetical protein
MRAPLMLMCVCVGDSFWPRTEKPGVEPIRGLVGMSVALVTVIWR